MAELDAAFFLLYGIDRDDAEYILGTFSGGDSPRRGRGRAVRARRRRAGGLRPLGRRVVLTAAISSHGDLKP